MFVKIKSRPCTIAIGVNDDERAGRWVGKSLKDLQETIPKEWLWIVEEVRQLLDVLHPEGSQRLHALWKQLPGRSSRSDQTRSAMEQLRDLLLV